MTGQKRISNVATDPATEVDHILMGEEARARGIYWLAQGSRELAETYFRVGSLHGITAADEDLAALRGTAGSADAGRAPVRAMPPVRRPAWSAGVRSRATLIGAAAALAAVVSTSVAVVSSQTPPPPAQPLKARAVLQVPTALPSEPAAPQMKLDLRTGAPSSPDAAPGGTTPTPSRSTAPKPEPPAAPRPVISAEAMSGPHVFVSREDKKGERFTALMAIEESDGWRQLRFEAAPRSRFRATLWSDGRQPCTWRFTGTGTADSAAGEVMTGEVEVAAGQQRDTTLDTREWPILLAEVRGGARPDNCLLVNQQFVPAESASSPSPDRPVFTTPPSSPAAPPATANPSHPVEGRQGTAS